MQRYAVITEKKLFSVKDIKTNTTIKIFYNRKDAAKLAESLENDFRRRNTYIKIVQS